MTKFAHLWILDISLACSLVGRREAASAASAARPAARLNYLLGRRSTHRKFYFAPIVLILASASPRRRELLLAAGIAHRVQAANIPEIAQPGEGHLDFVKRMAREKADAIPINGRDIVLGADTVVCSGNQLFGKPADDLDLARMLRALCGQTHWVHTGVCLRTADRLILDHASTAVAFHEMSDDEITEYTRSGEGRDKAGGYAIQGLASRFVRAIEGSYHNVVGLPVSLVYRHLRALDYL